MNEIKFRAWNINEERMFNWDWCKDKMNFEIFANKSFRLMQFTGLKDKNGKEIYEGDLMEVDELKYEVFWDTLNCCWACETDEKEKANKLKIDGYFQLKEDESDCYEIIDDIYENPEILEEKNE